MTSTTAYESAVAAAFAAHLATAEPVVARASQASADTGEAVIVSFVGEASADLAVQLFDADALVDGLAGAALPTRLHDALEAATSTLGPGALGEPALGEASALLGHPLTQAFDLVDGTERVIGRFAVRITRGRASGDAAPARRLHRIAGVEMELTVEIGRTRMSVRDVLDLEPGRIVELDRAAGAPADIKLNGRIIGHGEVVVMDQDYAVRITRILENVEA